MKIFAVVVAAMLALPAVAPAHRGHGAKKLRTSVRPVRSDVAAYTAMGGRADLVANKRNANASLHLRGMVPRATYGWAIVQGADRDSVCSAGTPVTGLRYRTLRANRSGRANSSAKSRKGAFRYSPTAAYAVVVYQAGTTDEVLLCGVLQGKAKKVKKPGHHDPSTSAPHGKGKGH